jgi:hypothetical protein
MRIAMALDLMLEQQGCNLLFQLSAQVTTLSRSASRRGGVPATLFFCPRVKPIPANKNQGRQSFVFSPSAPLRLCARFRFRFPHSPLSPCPPFLRGKNSPQKNRKNLLDLLLNKTEIPLVCRFRINSLNPTLILHLQPHGPRLQSLSLPRRATLCAPVCWFAWWQRRRSRLEFARAGWGGSPLGIFENERVG